MADDAGQRPARRFPRGVRRVGQGARNVLDIMRHGRLGAPYRAEHEIAFSGEHYRLRHYVAPEPAEGVGPVLLVPPLMVTAEIYDISPELSAVAYLGAQGLDVWVVDFGAPEVETSGMRRTLDDHVLSVSDAVQRVHEATGRRVHLGGYSQGGMFAYQAAALRKTAGIASIFTFGSPVDIHRNIPNVRDELAERLIGFARSVVAAPLEHVPGLPGTFTSTVFKMLSARKEAQAIASFWQNVHDRDALIRAESRRRFLGGEGFVAWPGPALRTFVDEFIVHNRMASGGFVIDGQPVTLADISCPVLYFVGLRDELARAPAVRAIESAAPRARHFGIDVRAGHFGLVVGSSALRVSWPTVAEWVRWNDAGGALPSALAGRSSERDDDEAADLVDDDAFGPGDVRIGEMVDLATEAVDALWKGLGDVSREVGEIVDGLRWQVPRLAQMRRLGPTSRVGIGRALAEQARAIPHQTFFLWEGRAFSYAAANQRVDNVVRGLFHAGVTPGRRVAVYMRPRPSYLVTVAALNRMGAVAVLLGPDMARLPLERALTLSGATAVVCDPEGAARARAASAGPVLVLGGGAQRSVQDGVLDLEAIDPEAVELPDGFRSDAGVGGDLALIVFTSGDGKSGPRPVRITNRRWGIAALGAAATATLSTRDTVYTCLPFHHALGMMVAIGGALVGGARIAAAPRFVPQRFWDDVRRAGATVAFYSGDMLRLLLAEEPTDADARHPLRLLAGSGLGGDDWEPFATRFGRPEIIEFYASTEGPVVLANTLGAKPGAIGRPLADGADVALLEFDLETRMARRHADGRCRAVLPGRVGVLAARVDSGRPLGAWDGFVDPSDTESRLLRDVLEPGDVWFSTGDLARADSDGDFYFVGRKHEIVSRGGEFVPFADIDRALRAVEGVGVSCVWISTSGTSPVLLAAISVRAGRHIDPAALQVALDALPPYARPEVVFASDRLPLSAAQRVAGAALEEALQLLLAGTLYSRRRDGTVKEPTPSARSRLRTKLGVAAHA